MGFVAMTSPNAKCQRVLVLALYLATVSLFSHFKILSDCRRYSIHIADDETRQFRRVVGVNAALRSIISNSRGGIPDTMTLDART